MFLLDSTVIMVLIFMRVIKLFFILSGFAQRLSGPKENNKNTSSNIVFTTSNKLEVSKLPANLYILVVNTVNIYIIKLICALFSGTAIRDQ